MKSRILHFLISLKFKILIIFSSDVIADDASPSSLRHSSHRALSSTNIPAMSASVPVYQVRFDCYLIYCVSQLPYLSTLRNCLTHIYKTTAMNCICFFCHLFLSPNTSNWDFHVFTIVHRRSFSISDYSTWAVEYDVQICITNTFPDPFHSFTTTSITSPHCLWILVGIILLDMKEGTKLPSLSLFSPSSLWSSPSEAAYHGEEFECERERDESLALFHRRLGTMGE